MISKLLSYPVGVWRAFRDTPTWFQGAALVGVGVVVGLFLGLL